MAGSAMQEETAGRRPTPDCSTSLQTLLHASDGILELMPVATWICDLGGRIVQYNRRATEIWGRIPKPGETYKAFTAQSRFYDSNGRPLREALVSVVLASAKPIHDAEILVSRPGRPDIAVLLNIEPLFDAKGQLMGAINCSQDITERKRALLDLQRSRETLREQEERWNATYNHAAIGIVEVDAEGRFLRVNEAICSIIGRSREELLGWRLQASTHPEDRDHDGQMYRRQVRGELDFYFIEKRFVRGDGQTIWAAIRSSTVRDSSGRFLYGVRVVQDITERREAEARQKVLIDELNHRVKNTLATVQSLASQTARGAQSPEEFRQAFEGRLIAVSHAHDQLTRRHWTSADLRELVIATTAPYVVRSGEQLIVEGPQVTLTPRAGLTLALVFHELTTNAAKYGALSQPEGRVEIRWGELDQSGQSPSLRIEWSERGGPRIAPPLRPGFGSRFIESSVAMELQGTARLHYDPDGVRCLVEIPVQADAVSD